VPAAQARLEPPPTISPRGEAKVTQPQFHVPVSVLPLTLTPSAAMALPEKLPFMRVPLHFPDPLTETFPEKA
jgi:hypothetical protein